MYKITFTEGRGFTGVYLSVAFRDGVGETDSHYLAERFRQKGMVVEPDAPKRKQQKKPAEEE